MAEQIRQVFTIDAGQALQALSALDRGFASLGARMQSLSGSLKSSTSSFRTAGRSVDQFAKTNKRASESITLSWQTIGRVFQTQVILRAMNLFRDAVRAGVEEINDLQISVARISTIARGPGSSIQELTGSLNDLAVELGRPIDEITGAAYEALQNDLGSTAETMELLEGAAHNLALVTGSDLASSVNSISSVMKSYNLDASQAADVTDTLFVAIDKGRITLSELENRLGTVDPLMASLGGTFQESAAAAASLTLSGLNTSKAYTQLRNILQKLIKPTDELKGAFERLGVTSGNELVQRFGGLQGALNALRQAFNNNDQAVARAFGTIRGQLGVLNLLANEGSNFTKVLEAMEDRAGRAEEAVRKIDSVTARNLEREVQRARASMRELALVAQRTEVALLKTFNAVATPGSEKIAQNRVIALKQLNIASQEQLRIAKESIEADIQRAKSTSVLFGDQQVAFEKILNLLGQVQKEQATIEAQQRQASNAFKINLEAASRLQKETELFPTPFDDARGFQRAKELSAELAQLRERIAGASASQLAQLKQEQALIARNVQEQIKEGDIGRERQNALEGQLFTTNQLLEIQKRLNQLSAEKEKIDAKASEGERLIEEFLGGAAEHADQLQQNMSGVPTSAQQIVPALDQTISRTGVAIQAANQLAAAYQRAAAAASQATPPANAAFGGRFFAHGGRGPDTISAMLRPGEFVTNPRASANFAAELQAINANQTPVFRDRGGDVTNVGDINVNISTDSTRGIDARQVAQQIRREIRRGSISSL